MTTARAVFKIASARGSLLIAWLKSSPTIRLRKLTACSLKAALSSFSRVASLYDGDPLLSEFVGAQLIVRVRAEAIFPNCPRYIHRMQLVEHSEYVPRQGHTPPIPKWKQRPEFKDVLPAHDPAACSRD